ncbi:hypothetical protein EVAR_59233_1 [Eumeta japonica]|uniref:Uncharacterized protein n=1 Tax=Eumeta variegata TaxID=151549 RepID=A0A4C1ZJJ9_EUMVA|nr:hypothetical protein EVAR_59233_1 [Eumeta japonica]
MLASYQSRAEASVGVCLQPGSLQAHVLENLWLDRPSDLMLIQPELEVPDDHRNLGDLRPESTMSRTLGVDESFKFSYIKNPCLKSSVVTIRTKPCDLKTLLLHRQRQCQFRVYGDYTCVYNSLAPKVRETVYSGLRSRKLRWSSATSSSG